RVGHRGGPGRSSRGGGGCGVIVRRLDDLLGTDREVDGGTWVSRRLALADDALGYSLHDTVIRAGTTTEMWYRHHVESVYVVEGTGILEDRETGDKHDLSPG